MLSLYTPPSQAVWVRRLEYQLTIQRTGDRKGGRTPCFPGIPTSHSIKFIDPSADLVGLA